ncbi:hypothetical protein FRC10_001275 [Ceratobasidium sp. 414]|nr:hypothetical protein FRC10_001275 [Ceratobasidium sp. 414]
MRRAPSTRMRQNDALRNSVFDAAQEIGLAGPNALQWLEQNANISEEDEEEEEVKREPRPPSDTHPPSLVFSTSSSEPDSSINSPSNDLSGTSPPDHQIFRRPFIHMHPIHYHSTNFRAPYPRPAAKVQYQAYAQSQFHSQLYQPSPQLQIDTRSPINPDSRNSPNPLARPPPASLGLKIPDPWPPAQLAVASLSPSPQSASRAPTPADTINSKQAEPKKTRKLTKAPRVEPEVVPPRKVSNGENGIFGLGGTPPILLPVLPFPSAISGETLSSDASVSGLSSISGSSSATVTQLGAVGPDQATQAILFPPTPTTNERSVFEDDNDDERPTFSTIPFSSSTTVTASNHKPNAPSTSTAASADAPSSHPKEGGNSVMRAMRSFKLSLKGQKAPKVPLPEAPVVPAVPSLPPVLTLKLGPSAAGLVEDLRSQANEERKASQEKEREERALKLAELFKPSEPGPNTSSVYTIQSSEAGVHSDVGHAPSDHGHSHPPGPQSDQGHAPIRVAGGGGGFWSANVGTKKDRTNKPPRVAKGRRMSVDEVNAAGEAVKETVKVTERTRAGTVGTRSGHTRTRSKSGDFSGAGWEKGVRPPVPNSSKGSKPPKVTVKRIANPDPTSPKLSFDSETRHSLERSGFGARAELDEIRALDVQHQLQSFVASMRGISGEDEEDVQGGFSRGSEESFDQRAGPRIRGNDSDTLRSSGDYDPDPFRAFVGQPRITVPLPRPESEAIPHQLVIPAYSIPKEVGQTSVPALAPMPKRVIPPTAFKSFANVPPAGGVRASIGSAKPLVVGEPRERLTPGDTTSKADQSESHSRAGSQESEFGLGYSGFGFARAAATADNNDASEEWVVPSPSWAPLDPKRGRSPGPDIIAPEPQPKFLGIRLDRQRASGLSIPRSVTPDSPMPTHLGSATLLAPSRSVTPLAAPRSITPLARSATPLGAAKPAFVPLVSRSLTPQPQTEAGRDRLSRGRDITPPQRQGTIPARQPLQPEERNAPSPTIPRRALPVRTSSISSVSSGDHSLGHGSRVRSPPPRIVVPSPVPGPRSAQAAPMPRSMTSTPISRSATSTPLSRGPVPRSMSTTPTPRASEEEQPLRHEAFSRFLAPETIPAAQKRGRVSPFPTRPVREPGEGGEREAAESRTSWEAPEENQPSQREKYPGGGEKYGSDGLMQVPRVRFIGVRSSNGSSQAGWQGRMEDMRNGEPPARIGSWAEHEEDGSRPVSWEVGLAHDEDPAYSTYDGTQEYDGAAQYSAYTDEHLEDDARSTMPPTPMGPEANPDVVAAGTLRPSGPGYPGWAVDAPASRASTYTVASEYDDGEPIPPVPNTQKLAAAVRGMGQSTWSRGRI